MSESTGISWAKSTFNPWIGCTKVGPGCDHCYAEKLDATGRFGPAHWGPGVARRRTSAGNWAEVRRWNRKAPETVFNGRKGFWPVFCSSLADVFDNEVDPAWRVDLLELIAATPNLTWLLLTKRIGNAERMMLEAHDALCRRATIDVPPPAWPANVWLGATVVNQEEADRDIPKLLAIPAARRWLSVEPMLGPMDLRPWLGRLDRTAAGLADDPLAAALLQGAMMDGSGSGPELIDWVIVGGESLPGGNARPMELAWAAALEQQCRAAGVAYHFKQLGHWLARSLGADGKGKDPREWPVEIRLQEYPR